MNMEMVLKNVVDFVVGGVKKSVKDDWDSLDYNLKNHWCNAYLNYLLASESKELYHHMQDSIKQASDDLLKEIAVDHLLIDSTETTPEEMLASYTYITLVDFRNDVAFNDTLSLKDKLITANYLVKHKYDIILIYSDIDEELDGREFSLLEEVSRRFKENIEDRITWIFPISG